MNISDFILVALLTGTDGGTWAACEFGMTVGRGMDSIRGSARVTDVASQAHMMFPLLNAHGPGAEPSLATLPCRVLYAHGGPGGSP